MLLHVFETYWHRRSVRVLAGVLVFALALGVQYYLTDIPVPADLAGTERFTPATVRLGQEELIIEEPEVNSSEGIVFSHAGATNEIVDIRFERARLDTDTVDMLTALGDSPPTGPTQVDYVPQEAAQAAAGREPCRTFVTVAWARTDEPPAALRFFQLEAPGLDNYRYVEMQATGSELAVRLLSKSASDDNVPGAPGCRSRLRAGELEELLGGSVGLNIVAAPDAKFRWHFRRRAQGQPPWGSADGLFEPFTLGAPQTDPNEKPPLRARAIRIRALHADASAPDILSARSTDKGPPLSISGLKIGSDQLQLNVTGNGWVKINGADRTVNVFERVEKYPLTSALLGALNSALLAWIGYAIFGHHKPATGEHEPPPS